MAEAEQKHHREMKCLDGLSYGGKGKKSFAAAFSPSCLAMGPPPRQCLYLKFGVLA